MDVKELLPALSLTGMAVAPKSFYEALPILTCYCFDGEHVWAFNDSVSISSPCDVPIDGAVPGELLFGAIKNARSKTIGLDLKGDTLVVKSGGSRFKFPVFRPEEIPFVFPKEVGDIKILVKLQIGAKFFSALVQCLQFSDTQSGKLNQNGVTMRLHKSLTLYSTNRVSITRMLLVPKYVGKKSMSKLPEYLILTRELCKTAIDMYKALKVKKATMSIGNDSVLLEFPGGEKLLGKFPPDHIKPLPFRKTIKSLLKYSNDDEFFEIPEGFDQSVKQASLFVSNLNSACSLVRHKKGITLSVEGDTGSMWDDHPVEAKRISEQEVEIDPRLVAKTLPFSETMAISSYWVVFKGKNYLSFVTSKKG